MHLCTRNHGCGHHAVLADEEISISLLAMVVLTAAVLLGVVTSASGARDSSADFVPGITVCVNAVDSAGTMLDRIPTLAGDPTPNSDCLPDSVLFRGTEGFTALPAPLLTVASGWIEPERPTRASFRIVCDDGARLSVGGVVVAEDDSRHAARASDSGTIDLRKGLTEIDLRHFDAVGGRVDHSR